MPRPPKYTSCASSPRLSRHRCSSMIFSLISLSSTVRKVLVLWYGSRSGPPKPKRL